MQMVIRCGLLSDDTTRAVWRHVVFFLCCFITSEGEATLDFASAAMLFTPETPEVFCGLKHFTHPSIGIVVGG